MKSELYLSNIFKSINSEMDIILIAFFFLIGKLENTPSLSMCTLIYGKSESFSRFPSRVNRIYRKYNFLNLYVNGKI